ncbi:indole-3-glycerol phosphate synthase TrpC [Alienimonas californiensis]|uniref:Indole-3-glycerol phosphate synthase n=1 Tax=Alienimonas californiensis TaxID=2527989 RepID=A0A517PEM7_9PLAN|nr:indole-3-glycerol phosphate synthase TrpC [Alienimonas californiensis]QDT17827.1 Indole-3-glycerol phosphate synthase [Alienimonas californiensis]
MATILDDILTRTRADLKTREAAVPLADLEAAAADMPPARDFTNALRPGNRGDRTPLGLIAEVKRASPSAGAIAEGADPVGVARTYEAAGAHCVSVLTDGPFFGGSLDDLKAVRAAIGLPVLRKDFVVSRYQLAEARAAGADAVLLIAECLPGEELPALHAAAGEFGLHTLIELYDPEHMPHVAALAAAAPERTVIGVNNRDLRTFTVDLEHSLRLVADCPAGVTFVSESGIRTREEIDRLAAAGVGAVLIGETLMRAPDPAAKVRELIGG